jgi:hypothetical protein
VAAWWDNIVAIHPPGRVFTWDEFKKKFREANVPESIMELKRREFDNRTEGQDHYEVCQGFYSSVTLCFRCSEHR